MRATYTLRFQAPARLKDGTEVLLRAVRPDDKDLISEGFGRLSEASRYRRFLHYKARLTPDELRYFTEIDGEHHYALGVVSADDERTPIGIGRLIRLPSSEVEEGASDTAEIAIAVMDAYQRVGVGRLLMDHLHRAAQERDIGRLRWTLFADNQAMFRLIEKVVGRWRIVEQDGPVMTVESQVTSHPLAHLRRANGFGWRSQLSTARAWARSLTYRDRA